MTAGLKSFPQNSSNQRPTMALFSSVDTVCIPSGASSPSSLMAASVEWQVTATDWEGRFVSFKKRSDCGVNRALTLEMSKFGPAHARRLFELTDQASQPDSDDEGPLLSMHQRSFGAPSLVKGNSRPAKRHHHERVVVPCSDRDDLLASRTAQSHICLHLRTPENCHFSADGHGQGRGSPSQRWSWSSSAAVRYRHRPALPGMYVAGR